MCATILVLALALASSQQPQDPGTLAREVLRGGYQTEIPDTGNAARDPGDRAGRGRRGRRPEGDASGGRRRTPEPGPQALGSSTGGAVLWILLGLAAAVGLAALFARARGYHRDVELGEAAATPTPAPVAASLAPRAADEADALARAGRFADAIRLLLQLAFDALRRAQGTPLPAWWTSREILARTSVPGPAGAALRALVDAVERAVFAARPAGAADYHACAQQYRALLEAAPAAGTGEKGLPS